MSGLTVAAATRTSLQFPSPARWASSGSASSPWGCSSPRAARAAEDHHHRLVNGGALVAPPSFWEMRARCRHGLEPEPNVPGHWPLVITPRRLLLWKPIFATLLKVSPADSRHRAPINPDLMQETVGGPQCKGPSYEPRIASCRSTAYLG